MNWWIPVLIVAVVAFGWFATRKGWIDLSNKQRSSGGAGALGVMDEVFAPHRHEIEALKQREASLPVEAPVPGDGDKGIALPLAEESGRRFDGRIRLDLP